VFRLSAQNSALSRAFRFGFRNSAFTVTALPP